MPPKGSRTALPLSKEADAARKREKRGAEANAARMRDEREEREAERHEASERHKPARER